MIRIREWKHLSVMSMSAKLKVDIVFNVFFCSLGLMVQDDVVGFVCVVFSTNKDKVI